MSSGPVDAAHGSSGQESELTKPPEPTAPLTIRRSWWGGLGLLVAAMVAFVVLSIRYGSQLEVDAFLAAAEISLVVVAVFGLYLAIKYRVSI
jgi:hypothetical protein